MLKYRFDKRDFIDPIILNDIDDSNEWLVEKMEKNEPVFEDDDLTWDVVQQASEAGEPLVNTRQASSSTRQSSASTCRFMQIEEEESSKSDNDTDAEEEIGGCNLEAIESDIEEFDDCDVDDDPIDD